MAEPRRSLLDIEAEDDDPILSVVNIIDVFLVVIAVLLRVIHEMGLSSFRVNGIPVPGPVIFGGMVWLLYLRFVIPVLGAFYGTSLMSDEVEDRTLTYLFTRPVPRGAVILGKYLAYLVCTALVVLPSVTAVYLLITPVAGGSIGGTFTQLLTDLGLPDIPGDVLIRQMHGLARGRLRIAPDTKGIVEDTTMVSRVQRALGQATSTPDQPAPGRVAELDWWGELRDGPLVFGCAPAQHFSGRAVTDRDRTLWCSWAIASGVTPFSSPFFASPPAARASSTAPTPSTSSRTSRRRAGSPSSSVRRTS